MACLFKINLRKFKITNLEWNVGSIKARMLTDRRDDGSEALITLGDFFKCN